MTDDQMTHMTSFKLLLSTREEQVLGGTQENIPNHKSKQRCWFVFWNYLQYRLTFSDIYERGSILKIIILEHKSTTLLAFVVGYVSWVHTIHPIPTSYSYTHILIYMCTQPPLIDWRRDARTNFMTKNSACCHSNTSKIKNQACQATRRSCRVSSWCLQNHLPPNRAFESWRVWVQSSATISQHKDAAGNAHTG